MRNGWCPVAEALDDPLVIVKVDERGDMCPCLLEVFEIEEPKTFFLHGPHETLGHTVALRLGDEGVGEFDSEPARLAFEDVRCVLGAPVQPQLQSGGDGTGIAAEVLGDALLDGLERREAIADLGHVVADDLDRGVVDRAKEPAPAIPARVETRPVCDPHLVRLVRHDRSVMSRVAVDAARSLRHEQAVLAHQTKDPAPAHDGSAPVESVVDLALAFPDERAGFDLAANQLQKLSVRNLRPRTRLHAHRVGIPPIRRRVTARAGQAKELADHREGVPASRGRTDLVLHRPSFFRSSPKPLFFRSTSASSSSIISSPTLARARVSSRSWSGSPRLLSWPLPPSMKTRRHSSTWCAGTPISRETVASSSPRKSRKTTSALRPDIHLSDASPASVAATSPPASVASTEAPLNRLRIRTSLDTRCLITCPRKPGAVYSRSLSRRRIGRQAIFLTKSTRTLSVP